MGKKNKSKQYFILAKITDKKGRVLSFANNSYVKTHPLQSKYARLKRMPCKEFLHAEIGALIKLKNKDKRKAQRITIYRFDNNGKTRLAKPCPICMAAIKEFGIEEIYYTKDGSDDDCDIDYDQYAEIKAESNDWGGSEK